jgi:hypothetical protein
MKARSTIFIIAIVIIAIFGILSPKTRSMLHTLGKG